MNYKNASDAELFELVGLAVHEMEDAGDTRHAALLDEVAARYSEEMS